MLANKIITGDEAVPGGLSTGTVTVLEGTQMDECLRNHHGSAHNLKPG